MRVVAGVLEDVERNELERRAHSDKTGPIVARFERILFARQVEIEMRCIAEHDVETSVGQAVGRIFSTPAQYVIPDVCNRHGPSGDAASIGGGRILFGVD